MCNDALKFSKFIQKNDIEYHYDANDETQEVDVVFFVPYYLMEDLVGALPSSCFDEAGIICAMKDGYFAFWASDILSEWGVELEEVFERDLN